MYILNASMRNVCVQSLVLTSTKTVLLRIKPSTHIVENRKLTIGVSERQIGGQRFSSGLFFSAVLIWAMEIPEKIPDLARI